MYELGFFTGLHITFLGFHITFHEIGFYTGFHIDLYKFLTGLLAQLGLHTRLYISLYTIDVNFNRLYTRLQDKAAYTLLMQDLCIFQ